MKGSRQTGSRSEAVEEIRASFSVLQAQHDALAGDFTASLRELTQDGSQRRRREMVRAFFAYLEAMVWLTKRLALLEHEAGHVAFGIADVAALREESYRVDVHGHAITERSKIPLRGNLLLAMRLFSEAYNLHGSLKTDGVEWQRFIRCIQLRDRLTHPKSTASIEVSDVEVDEVRLSFEWLLQGWLPQLVGAGRAIRARTRARLSGSRSGRG